MVKEEPYYDIVTVESNAIPAELKKAFQKLTIQSP